MTERQKERQRVHNKTLELIGELLLNSKVIATATDMHVRLAGAKKSPQDRNKFSQQDYDNIRAYLGDILKKHTS